MSRVGAVTMSLFSASFSSALQPAGSADISAASTFFAVKGISGRLAEFAVIGCLFEDDYGKFGRQLQGDGRCCAGRSAQTARSDDQISGFFIFRAFDRSRNGYHVLFQIGFRLPSFRGGEVDRSDVLPCEGVLFATAEGKDLGACNLIGGDCQQNVVLKGRHRDSDLSRAACLVGDVDDDFARRIGIQVGELGCRDGEMPRTGNQLARPSFGLGDLDVIDVAAAYGVVAVDAECKGLGDALDRITVVVENFEYDIPVIDRNIVVVGNRLRLPAIKIAEAAALLCRFSS